MAAVIAATAWWAWSSSATLVAPGLGTLRVESDPSGADVIVDGVVRGSTPTELQVTAGRHLVVVKGEGHVHERTVTIPAGRDVDQFVAWPTPPVVPVEPAALAPLDGPSKPATNVPLGWVNVTSPDRLDVYEGLRRMGTSEDRRILLPPGTHVLDLIADPLGYRERRVVTIAGGRGVTLVPDLPRVPVFINAVPWADVLIDGIPVGQTPLGTIRQTIGTHQIEFRHPELGTRRQTIVVSQQSVTRVSVDMRTR
jgi:hypothetical protein